MDWLHHCQTLADDGDWTGVARVAGEWVTLVPDDVMAWVVRGEALGQQAQFEAAEAALQRAAALQPTSMDAWVVLGSVYYQQGKQAQVQRVYQTLTSLDPGTAQLFYDQFITPELQRFKPAFGIKIVKS